MADVNLIPPKRLLGIRRKARLRFWAGICGTYLAVALVIFFTTRVVWANNRLAKIDDEYEAAVKKIEQNNSVISSIKQKLGIDKQELEVCRAMLSQPDWSRLLVLIANELGDEIVLTSYKLFSVLPDGTEAAGKLKSWLGALDKETQLAERGYGIRLNGFGRSQGSVSMFVLRMEQIGIFSSVRLLNSNRQNFLNDNAVAFTIECRI